MPRAALALVLAVGFGFAFQALFYREGIGLNALVAVLLLFLVGWRLRWSTPQRIDWWMPAFALAFAAFLAIRAEMSVVVFNVLASLTLAAAWSASLRGVTVTTLPVVRLLGEAWDTATGALWRAVPAMPEGARAMPLGALRRHRLLPIVTGVLLALPLLLVFGALFTAADPVFARWWDGLIDLAGWEERLREGRDRGLIALVMAWLVTGAISWPAVTRENAPGRAGPLGSDTAAAFLATLALLFATFVGFQIAYLFGGRDTLEAASITHAEYARRGFFELLIVTVVMGAVLFVLDLATGTRTRAYEAVALTLLGLTGVILVSSVYRLALYQQEYGWSEQRLYAVSMIATVGVALAILAAAVVMRRMRHAVQPIVFAGLAIALIVNAIGPAGFVVRSNVSRLGPDFDPWYLVALGPSGLPDLVAGRQQLPDAERACVDLLISYQVAGGNEDEQGWQSWNLDRERARAARQTLAGELTVPAGRSSACDPFQPRGSYLPAD